MHIFKLQKCLVFITVESSIYLEDLSSDLTCCISDRPGHRGIHKFCVWKIFIPPIYHVRQGFLQTIIVSSCRGINTVVVVRILEAAAGNHSVCLQPEKVTALLYLVAALADHSCFIFFGQLINSL
ncbi:hypothetical protein CS542_07335 [Pedobacter sp. IW39]|nr:hypothetical protein CS542_07335 [Pedobacter sp. IW39]